MTLASKSTMSPFEAARCVEAYVQRIEDCTVAMCLLDTEACPAILIAARSPAKCKKCYGSNEHGGMHCEGFWGVLHAFMETLLRLHKTSPWHHSAWPPGLRKLPITSLSESCDSLTSTSHWSDGLATEKVFGIQSIEKRVEHVERASIGISINRMIAVPGWPALWKHMERSSPQRRAPSSASASAHIQIAFQPAPDTSGRWQAWRALPMPHSVSGHVQVASSRCMKQAGQGGPSKRARCPRAVLREGPQGLGFYRGIIQPGDLARAVSLCRQAASGDWLGMEANGYKRNELKQNSATAGGQLS